MAPHSTCNHSSSLVARRAEHNWGLSTYTYLHNYTYFLAWNNTIFGYTPVVDDDDDDESLC